MLQTINDPARAAMHSMLRDTYASSNPQPYRIIHKALRRMMADTLMAVGLSDDADVSGRDNALQKVGLLLDVCEEHLQHEQAFFHDHLRVYLPRLVDGFDADHAEHLAAIESLRALVARCRASTTGDEWLSVLYLELSRFIGENFEHMAEEESVLTRALWDQLGAARIEALEADLVSRIPAERMRLFESLMTSSLSAADFARLAKRD